MRRSIFAALLFFLLFSAAGSARADSLEQQEAFSVDFSLDAEGRTKLTATLRKMSEKLYFYVEDAWWGSLSFDERN
ncbi:hypothetical protein KKI17_02970, partial [Patescibacteria group bacterium]|nr:hypothetical protein [Patescibacteria group bacterium]